MERRAFGKTGRRLSVIGFGGILVMGRPQEEANRLVHEAIDRGVNYFDVAPSYGDAEDRLGPALVGRRDGVFLACKTAHRTKAEAASELRASLAKLRTDRFDLYQLHGLPSTGDVETCFRAGGAMEAVLEAKQAGLVRYVGFSAHSAEGALLALEKHPFDSVLFPFNFATWHQAAFGPQVMEAAKRRGAARLGLKAMALRPWPEGAERRYRNCWYEPIDEPAEASLAVRWAMSLDLTATIPPGEPALFRLAMDIADRYTPLTADERNAVERMAMRHAPLFRTAA